MNRMINLRKNRKSGFTLLEILLVVAAIGILAGIAIFAINPVKQLGDTRDAQRKVDVNTILNAVYQYVVDNRGSFPEEITSEGNFICKTDSNDCSGLVDLAVITDAEYILSMPVDPQQPESSDSTGYVIYLDGTLRHVVV